MKITNVRVYDLEETILASGFPMLAKFPDAEEFKQSVIDLFTLQGECKYEKKDIFEESPHFKRAKKLAKAKGGSGHDCFLKGIVVNYNLYAPQYFWQQWQRYHHHDIISSQSKMHCLVKMPIDDCVMPDTKYMAREVAKDAIKAFNNKEIDIDECLAHIPLGLEYGARATSNYLQLKTIYKQRRTHRSKQWQVFCDWIETLPYAKEFIIGN